MIAVADEAGFMEKEIELKLEMTGEAADQIEASGLLAGNPKITQQKSIYFDTPDGKLRKAGFSLRIRHSDGKRIQTVKADRGSAAGLFARSEWEQSVNDDVPILDDSAPIRALLGEATETIASVFEVRIDRHTWLMNEGDTLIELVLDRGEAVVCERRSSICEIELELKSGATAALFALARRIDAAAPARLGVLTKAERGNKLTEPLETAAKAEPVKLANHISTEEAFRTVVNSCIRHFRLNEAIFLEDRNAAALHQSRVAIRRLRSAFSIFEPMIGNAGADLREGFRWLASELGDARNLDVLLERAKPGQLRDRIIVARETAYDRVCEVLSSPRVRLLMLDFAEWAAGDTWAGSFVGDAGRDQSARKFAIKALNRFRRKVKKDGRDLANADDGVRHELRKDAKKLRYAAEFFVSLFDSKDEKRRYKRFVRVLQSLQDQLGSLNDFATAPAVLEKLGITNEVDARELLASGKKKHLLRAAEETHNKLTKIKRFWK